jgi:tetraacyldisaccharide 4'-kinase
VVVSKCPPTLGQKEKDALLGEIKPFPGQRVFFSTYRYGTPYYLFNPLYKAPLEEDMDVVLLSGIANPEYLVTWLQERVGAMIRIEYPDHHYFEAGELYDVQYKFRDFQSGKKIILTTEKDAMRLHLHRELIIKLELPIYVLPIEVDFLFDEGGVFDEAVKTFLLEFKV